MINNFFLMRDLKTQVFLMIPIRVLFHSALVPVDFYWKGSATLSGI